MSISLKGIVSVAFLQKENFTGSYKMMNYRLERQAEPEAILVVIWKGPYNFLTTKEEKQSKCFSFDKAGLIQCEQWLNEVYRERI